MQWRVGSSGVVKNDESRAMLASTKGISEMFVASFMIWFKLKMRPSASYGCPDICHATHVSAARSRGEVRKIIACQQ